MKIVGKEIIRPGDRLQMTKNGRIITILANYDDSVAYMDKIAALGPTPIVRRVSWHTMYYWLTRGMLTPLKTGVVRARDVLIIESLNGGKY